MSNHPCSQSVLLSKNGGEHRWRTQRAGRTGEKDGMHFRRVRVERYMQAVFGLSAIALFVPVFFHTTTKDTESKAMLGELKPS